MTEILAAGEAEGMLPGRGALVAHARAAIAQGSRSFAAASRLFDRQTRERVRLLYAWCRACDDLADGQDHGQSRKHAPSGQPPAAARLAEIREKTDRAFRSLPTGDPAFDRLGQLAREVPVTHAMAREVIAGFALDAQDWRPRTEADLLRYCYHVAGAVGVMAAVVMGVPPDDEATLDRACDLGIAFQLTNIARDVSEDDAAGRCYLPVGWLAEADVPPGELTKPPYRDALVRLVARLGALERVYEASARAGAARLAFRQRWAVLSDAAIYGEIAREIERRGAHAWDHRVHTTRNRKRALVGRGLLDSLRRPDTAPAPTLSRPQLMALARG